MISYGLKVVEQDESSPEDLSGIFYFKWGGQVGLIEEAAFEWRLERGEGINDVGSWRKSIPAEGTRASAKAPRWEHAWHVRGTARRPVWWMWSEQGGEQEVSRPGRWGWRAAHAGSSRLLWGLRFLLWVKWRFLEGFKPRNDMIDLLFKRITLAIVSRRDWER